MKADCAVVLKELTIENASDEYFSWLNDPNVNKYLESRHRKHDQQECSAFIGECSKREDVILLGIFLEGEDRHIGNVKIGPIDSVNSFAEIGLLIGERSMWGRGIGTHVIKEAIEYARSIAGIRTLCATVCEPNTGSRRAFEKAGFSQTGRIPNRWRFEEGRFIDDIVYTCDTKIFASNDKLCIHLYGGGDILEECHQYLKDYDKRHRICVVTSERLLLGFSQSFLDKNGDEVYVANKAEDYEALILAGNRPDLVISCGPDSDYFPGLLKSCGRGVYSLHPVADMKYLGGAHHTWQLLNGESEAGFIVQQMLNTDERDGRTVCRAMAPITSMDTPESIFSKSVGVGKQLLHEFLERVLYFGNLHDHENEKDEGKVRVWPRLFTLKNGWVNWDWESDDIISFLRAFGRPYGGALSTYMKKIVRIEFIERASYESFHPFASGVITGFKEEEDVAEVITRDGVLKVRLRAQDQEQLNIKPGTRLISGQKELEKAKESHVISPSISVQA